MQVWNTGAERMYGYRSHEIVGQDFSITYTSDNVQRRPAGGRAADRGGAGPGPKRGLARPREWLAILGEHHAHRPARRGGGADRFAGVTRDLSDWRQAEVALAQSEESFRLLVQSVRDYAIFMLDPTGHIATWNAGAERIKGYTAEEITGQHFSIFYPLEDKLAGKPARELEIAIPDGNLRRRGLALAEGRISLLGQRRRSRPCATRTGNSRGSPR